MRVGPAWGLFSFFKKKKRVRAGSACVPCCSGPVVQLAALVRRTGGGEHETRAHGALQKHCTRRRNLNDPGRRGSPVPVPAGVLQRPDATQRGVPGVLLARKAAAALARDTQRAPRHRHGHGVRAQQGHCARRPQPRERPAEGAAFDGLFWTAPVPFAACVSLSRTFKVCAQLAPCARCPRPRTPAAKGPCPCALSLSLWRRLLRRPPETVLKGVAVARGRVHVQHVPRGPCHALLADASACVVVPVNPCTPRSTLFCIMVLPRADPPLTPRSTLPCSDSAPALTLLSRPRSLTPPRTVARAQLCAAGARWRK